MDTVWLLVVGSVCLIWGLKWFNEFIGVFSWSIGVIVLTFGLASFYI